MREQADTAVWPVAGAATAAFRSVLASMPESVGVVLLPVLGEALAWRRCCFSNLDLCGRDPLGRAAAVGAECGITFDVIINYKDTCGSPFIKAFTRAKL